MFEYDTDIVQSLLLQDDDFRRLYSKHDRLKQQVKQAHERKQLLDDITLEKLKKEKLLIKDRMAAMIESYRRTHA